MYDYNLTASETADFIADMLIMAGEWEFPSDEAIAEMAGGLGGLMPSFLPARLGSWASRFLKTERNPDFYR